MSLFELGGCSQNITKWHELYSVSLLHWLSLMFLVAFLTETGWFTQSSPLESFAAFFPNGVRMVRKGGLWCGWKGLLNSSELKWDEYIKIDLPLNQLHIHVREAWVNSPVHKRILLARETIQISQPTGGWWGLWPHRLKLESPVSKRVPTLWVLHSYSSCVRPHDLC